MGFVSGVSGTVIKVAGRRCWALWAHLADWTKFNFYLTKRCYF
jgi:hypothetical protein